MELQVWRVLAHYSFILFLFFLKNATLDLLHTPASIWSPQFLPHPLFWFSCEISLNLSNLVFVFPCFISFYVPLLSHQIATYYVNNGFSSSFIVRPSHSHVLVLAIQTIMLFFLFLLNYSFAHQLVFLSLFDLKFPWVPKNFAFL